jgi:hypothetical protein
VGTRVSGSVYRKVTNRGTGVVLTAVALFVVALTSGGCLGGADSKPRPAGPPSAGRAAPAPGQRNARDWPRFGFDTARTDAAGGPPLAAGSVSRLRRRRVSLPGTVDSSPIYLEDVKVRGALHDVFFMTTTYGRTIALDSHTARVLWTFSPARMASWEGTSQITTASPVADPGGRYVFATSPDGRVHKLVVASGREAPGWPVAITRDPTHEKLGTALNLDRGRVIATTGGYLGDAPPYQGHVVVIDASSARIRGVFNALCADRHELLDPSSCDESGAAIWARAGVVVEPLSGRLLVATGDGRYDGELHWGDSILELSPDAHELVGSFTPRNQEELEQGDVDLGSSAPALLPGRLAVQAGKEGVVRLVDLARLRRGGSAALLQSLRGPGGVFSAPAVLRRGSARALVFYATATGTFAYSLRGRRLGLAWSNASAGTSPVLASGWLWVYDFSEGALNVYQPLSGKRVARLPAGTGHWNSPIVAAGRVALPEGGANSHQRRGVLDMFERGEDR